MANLHGTVINFRSPTFKPAGEISAPEASDAANDGTKNLSAQGASSLRQRAVKYTHQSHSNPVPAKMFT